MFKSMFLLAVAGLAVSAKLCPRACNGEEVKCSYDCAAGSGQNGLEDSLAFVAQAKKDGAV